MRIGLLTSIPATLDAFFPDWVQAWRAEGHHVAPASGPGPQGEAARIEGSTVISGITRDPSPINGTAHRRVRAWVRDERLDVVLTSTATASAVVRTARPGVPVVYFCHGLHTAGRSRDAVFLAAERVLLRATAGVVVLSVDDETWFLDRGRGRFPVLRLEAGIGLDLAAFPATPPPDEPGPRLVWIGELVPNKRPRDALALVEELRRRGSGASLTMLGDGPLLDEVRRAAPSYVEVAGRQAAYPALAAAHALVHTSAREGLPRVQLEAAAVGRPSFGYDIRGVRDAPGATVAGEVGDVVALAEVVDTWWRAGGESPRIDREALDWRHAHAAVTALLADTVTD